MKNFYFSLLSTSETLKNPFLYNEMHNLTISHIKFVCYLDVKNFIPFFIKYTKRYSLLKTETILLVFFFVTDNVPNVGCKFVLAKN